ncbi:phage replisome organizer N-terminal domain-containing protein [Brochothrix thermosphacta]|uniref:phage replisome organizer N-terminal domain-containing protein n=1 Tax=Brochothrix thermosphacta TaxID=2756 RepID=UPI00083F8C43|nr:phage replisome organizer N-terminal domain-containing protein [Brochothrix thermosphacta]ODJ63267.1 hypothetical protein BFR35_01420 [Brochothrix thermosphacta]
MSDSKKYYYLKLKESFFDSDEMKVLEAMSDGHKYSNILLKLYLKSLKNEGKLMLNDHIPYNTAMLATITNHSVGDVERALNILESLSLIEVLDNGSIYMSDIQTLIGKSSSEGDRKKAYRMRIEAEKTGAKALGQTSGQMSDIRTPELELELELELEKELEIEIEKELEIEKERDIVPQSETVPPYKTIIDYLNDKAGTKYRSSSKDTQKHIKARFNNGFTLEDFKSVIDNKVSEWGNNTKMSTYLRPATLFGTKFESYLNQKGGGESAIFSEDVNKFSNAPVTDDDTLPF